MSHKHKHMTKEHKEYVRHWQERQKQFLLFVADNLEEHNMTSTPIYRQVKDILSKWPFVRDQKHIMRQLHKDYQELATRYNMELEKVYEQKQCPVPCPTPAAFGGCQGVAHWCDLPLGHDGPHQWACEKARQPPVHIASQHQP